LVLMSLKKPFRAVPIKLEHAYREKERRAHLRNSIRLAAGDF